MVVLRGTINVVLLYDDTLAGLKSGFVALPGWSNPVGTERSYTLKLTKAKNSTPEPMGATTFSLGDL